MKKTIALTLALALFCAAFSCLLSAPPRNPFSAADRARKEKISASLSEMQADDTSERASENTSEKASEKTSEKLPENASENASERASEKVPENVPDKQNAARQGSEAGGCVVKFKDSAALGEINRVVARYPHRLLADSAKRLFWIGVPSASAFASQNHDIVEAAEDERVLKLSATVNDPLASSQWELDYIQAYGAWDIATGDRSVTVAVLDSGIYRAHPDFESVSIPAGYDAIERQDGVADDKNGHGTQISSIIAAAADNGIGMAGVARNVTILPVRVSDSSGYIHSSDFIEAVYYAADAGADVINMSFGGYAYSAIEAVAIQYADEKGCVLVSAAGNQEVSTQYAGMKAYPASYAGVISVGAVDSGGMLCTFSQRNDDVDLVAPGEDVTVANLGGGYERASGTSFACAFVSAVAALCLSTVDEGCAFNSDQFLSLVAGINAAERDEGRDEGYGCGDINALAALENVNKPLVAGVANGGVYHKNIEISFNRGRAKLDGKAFQSGDSVITSGSHELEVKDGENTLELSFVTDNIPLTYDYSIDASGACVSFTRGKATMDGAPYLSGTPVTTSGRHRFRLTGPYGNTESYDFECSFKAPAVFGVENGGFYTAPVHIRTSGEGGLTLNGAAISSGTVVSQSGGYNLVSTAADGIEKNHIYFTILLPSVTLYNSPLVSPGIIADAEQRVLMLSGRTLSGVRVVSWDDVSKTRCFVRTRLPVIGSAFSDEKAALIHETGISAFKRAALSASAGPTPTYFAFEKSASAAASYGGYVYYVCALGMESQLWRMDIESGQSTLLTNFSGKADLLSTDGFTLAAASSDGDIFVFGQNGTLQYKMSSGGKIGSLAVCGDCLCTNDCVYSVGTKEKLFSLNDGEKVLLAKNGVLVTDHSIYDLNERRPLGRFGERTSAVALTEGGFVFKALENMKIEAVHNENEELSAENAARLFNAASADAVPLGEEKEKFKKQKFSDFESYVRIPEDWNFTSAVIPEGSAFIYAISPSERALCAFDRRTLSLKEKLRLRFEPSCICGDAKSVYISFGDEAAVFALSADTTGESANLADGRYLSCDRPYTKLLCHGEKLCALNDRGDLFAFSPTSPERAETVIRSQNVIDFTCAGDSIYAYLKPLSLPFVYKINADDYSVESTAQVSENVEKIFAASGKIFLGRKAYNAENLKFQYSHSGEVKTAYKNYFTTENGVYFADTGKLLGDLSVPSSLPLFDDSYSYYSFEKGQIYKVENVRAELHSLPEISGVTPNRAQRGPVSAVFPYGCGYLDGKPYASGELIENGGLHSLVIALPFGVSAGFEFVIEATINSIFLKAEKSSISVNESTKLTVTAQPLTYGVVSVSYSADSDCVLVHADGSVIGTKEGSCVVTATTADGLHSAQTELTVTKGELKFDSSYFYADPSKRMVKGISPGTSVETFFAAASETCGEVAIRADSGVDVSAGVIHTGMTAVLLNVNGEVIDAWQLSVTGDIDSDGYITANDWYALQEALKSPDTMSAAVAAAADTDGDGTATAFDLLALKEYLLGNLSLGKQSARPEREAHAKAHLTAPRLLASGTAFTAGLTLTEMKNARAVSGVLRCDGATLLQPELKIVGAYRESFYSAGENALHFFADLSPAALTKVLLIAKFEVPEGAAPDSQITLSCTDLVIYDGTAAAVEDASVSAAVAEQPPAEVLIFNLPDYVFDSEVLENHCLFPSETQKIHVSAYPEERCDIAGNTAFGSGSEASFAVVVRDGDGMRQYDYICEREKGEVHVPVMPNDYKNGNADLAELTITGAALLPPFDKAVTDYYAAADPHALKIEAKPENELSSISVSAYDPASGAVTVLCTAEDGSSKAYVIHVSEKFSLYADEAPSEKGVEMWLWIAPAAALLLAALAYAALAVKRAKYKKRR